MGFFYFNLGNQGIAINFEFMLGIYLFLNGAVILSVWFGMRNFRKGVLSWTYYNPPWILTLPDLSEQT